MFVLPSKAHMCAIVMDTECIFTKCIASATVDSIVALMHLGKQKGRNALYTSLQAIPLSKLMIQKNSVTALNYALSN